MIQNVAIVILYLPDQTNRRKLFSYIYNKANMHKTTINLFGMAFPLETKGYVIVTLKRLKLLSLYLKERNCDVLVYGFMGNYTEPL